jgi:hypothetical protein
MAKRFIDTDLFRKPFMRSLEAPYKALWIYLLCECDHAGIWVVELDVAQIRMGLKLDPDKVIEKMAGAVVSIDGGSKWYLPDFVNFQYGTLNPANRVHQSVLDRLQRYGIDPAGPIQNKPLASPLQGAKDKDKDKDMDIQGVKERAKERNTTFKKWTSDDFKEKCREVVEANEDRLPREQRKPFFDYWTEEDGNGRMRFQAQTFFDVGKRMDNWRRRNLASPQRGPKQEDQGMKMKNPKPWIA